MKICPACKYERTIQDDLHFPDYECPACGIILEKDKARQELEEFEKQRQQERQAKQERLKKEEEKKRLEEVARIKKIEQKQREEEKARRLQELEIQRVRLEREEQKRLEEEARLQKEAEDKLRSEQEARKRQAKETEMLREKRRQNIKQTARENSGTIISSPAAENEYQLFDMCPFSMLQSGKGLSIVGFGEQKNKLQHTRCMQKYCRLWTWKTDKRGETYAQGCSLQFLGLSETEIKKNFFLKNMRILEEIHPATGKPENPEDDG